MAQKCKNVDNTVTGGFHLKLKSSGISAERRPGNQGTHWSGYRRAVAVQRDMPPRLNYILMRFNLKLKFINYTYQRAKYILLALDTLAIKLV